MLIKNLRSSDPQLRYQAWALLYQCGGIVIAAAGFIVLILSIWSNTKSVSATVQNGTLTHVSGLGKLFLDRPELFPYFYENQQPPDAKEPCQRNDQIHKTNPPSASKQRNSDASDSGMHESRQPCYQDVLVAAIIFADTLDEVSIQSTRFAAQWDKPKAWDNWICDMLRLSPILRKYLNEDRQWYGDALVEKVDRVLQGKPCP